MFEELSRTHPLRLANNKRSKLHFLVNHDVNFKIIDEIEKSLGQKFSSEKRHQLLRRIQEEYKKRPLPYDSYEQWHESKARVAEDDASEQPKRKKRSKAKETAPPLEDFDEQVKKTIVEEVTKETQEEETSQAAEDSSEYETALLSEGESESESGEDLSSEESGDDDNDYEESEFEGETNPDSLYALRKLKQWKSSIDFKSTWARDRFNLKIWGLESVGDSNDHVSASITKQHLNSLTTLLHINILRRNWDLAYKVLCLVVRFDATDLRSLWPLALEILSRKKEQMRASGSMLKLDLVKEQQFLEWLHLSFPVSHTPINLTYSSLGPVYRSATRHYAPLYVITLLWELLVLRNYSKLRDLGDDLILQPPYSIDGVMYYILALGNIAECIHLASCYINFDRNLDTMGENEEIGDLAEDMMLLGSKDTIKSRILNNIKAASKLLGNCHKLKFEYPETLLHGELENLLSVLDDKIDLDLNQQVARELAPFLNKSGFIFKDNQVSVGRGQNVLSGKHLKKLIVGLDKRAGPVRSWIWEWMEVDQDDPGTLVCDFCGERVMKDKTTNRRIVSHLTGHHIDLTTINRYSKSRMGKYQATMAEILSTHDKVPDGSHTQKFVTNSAVVNKETQIVKSEPPRTQRATTSTCRSNYLESQTSQRKGPVDQRGATPLRSETDISGCSNASNTAGASVSAAFGAEGNIGPLNGEATQKNNEEDTNNEREIENADLESAVEENRECAVDDQAYNGAENQNSTSEDHRNFETHESSMNGSQIYNYELQAEMTQEELQVRSSPDFATPRSNGQFIRRYEEFSPNTTIDTQDEVDISRNFHEFALQTQESLMKKPHDAGDLSQDRILSSLHLESFNRSETTAEGQDLSGCKLEKEIEDENVSDTKQTLVKEESDEESERDSEEIYDDARNTFNTSSQENERSPLMDSQHEEGTYSQEDEWKAKDQKAGNGMEMEFDFDFE